MPPRSWEAEHVARSPARSTSLTAARLLPRQVRAARGRDRMAFLIEDLNGAYFTLVGRGGQAGRHEAAVARVQRLLIGVPWMSSAADAAWAYAEAQGADAEESFGAAAVLLALGPDDPRVRRWVATLPARVRGALRRVFGADAGKASPVKASSRRAPARRPRAGAPPRPVSGR
jgi:hypothetical protein